MQKWDKVIKKAFDIYLNRDSYCYLYGGKGQVVTEQLFNSLVMQYHDHYGQYTEADLVRIYRYSKGKICYDCSGFITALTGDYNYSAVQWSHCTPNESLAEGVAGSLLYKPGHIGIDVGYGLFLHFPIELHTCELSWIKDFNWVSSGRHRDIDYQGSTSI